MEPRPQPDVNCPWQLLRLKCKILGDDIARARQQLLEAKAPDRRRIARLEQAHRSQQRALTALSHVVYSP